ncbi:MULTISPECIES: ABC transporter permease [Clostridium]|uniref:ABC transporter permease n=1 Tax=Clostridium TaxID=1485 RepID=UPI000826F721|nr:MULTISPECIES: ABC transporter permease [Clostridium]PJI09404.1 ABC transporter permease [Clostridium sp. CT7]
MLRMIKKQLKLLFNNRIAMFFVILVPIALTYVFSSASTNNKINLYYADLDKTPYSSELISMLKNNNDLNLISASEATVSEKVDTNSVPEALIIDKNFQNDLFNDKRLNVKMVENYPSSESAIVKEAVLGETNTLKKAAIDSKNISGALNISKDTVSKDLLKKLKVNSNISINDKGNSMNQNTATTSLIGFLAMFLWFVIIQGFRTLIEEKENDTFSRILSTPISYSKYLISKIASTYIFSLILLIVTLTIGKYAFNITFAQNLSAEAAIFAIYLFAITGIVMIFVPFIKKQQTLTILGSILMALTGMLGGSFFPLDEVSSKVILTLSKFTPESWVLNSISDIIFNNAALSSEITSIIVLASIGIVGLSISYTLLNIKIKTERA